MSDQDIRKYINLVEAPSISDVTSRAFNKLKAAVGDDSAEGKNDSLKLANDFEKKYKKWIGQADLQIDNKSIMNFLVSHIKFVVQNARIILDTSNIADPTTGKIVKLSKSDVNLVMKNAAKFAFQHNLVKQNVNHNQPGHSSYRSTGTKPRYSSKKYYDDLARSNTRIDQTNTMIKDIKTASGDVSKGKSTENKMFSVDKEKFDNSLKQEGISTEHISDITDIAEKSKTLSEFEKNIKGRPDEQSLLKELAKIGFALAKARK